MPVTLPRSRCTVCTLPAAGIASRMLVGSQLNSPPKDKRRSFKFTRCQQQSRSSPDVQHSLRSQVSMAADKHTHKSFCCTREIAGLCSTAELLTHRKASQSACGQLKAQHNCSILDSIPDIPTLQQPLTIVLRCNPRLPDTMLILVMVPN
jgi:hypothetical protein